MSEPIAPGTAVRHTTIDLGVGEVIRSREVGGIPQHQVDFPQRGVARWLPTEQLVVIRGVQERLLAGAYEDRTRPFDVRTLAEGMAWANASTGELLVSNVDPLPHQILLTHRVVTSEPIRRLVADDVGLGKTIEAGMILSALRSRGRANRVLVVVPAGLVLQWIEEMEDKFGIALMPLSSAMLPATEVQWQTIRYAVASNEFLRMEPHQESVARSGPWDVVVFDEAHHLSRSSESVTLRYRLAETLLDPSMCRAAIMLTATPHQGNNEKFVNLLRLVREDLLGDWTDLQDEPGLINKIMLRNRKLDVTDADGVHIFDPPPRVSTCPVEPDAAFLEFQSAIEQYLRTGFSHAGEGESRAIGFVMTTYAKLASSSPRAIRGALERRRDRLAGRSAPAAPQPEEVDDRFEGEQAELVELAKRDESGAFFEGELDDLEVLAQAARRCEATDPKREEFLRIVGGLLAKNPEERVLVFTEYRGTQRYLCEALAHAFPGAEIVEIHGSMDLFAKRAAVRAFETTAKFLVSTEAGGEGINLQQRCHVMVNYDLPWNPMRLRQRIGRLYRYGQANQVFVFNMRTTGTADDTVLEHLRTKVEQIVKDLAGLDGDRQENLLDDVLGQTVAQIRIEDLVMDVHRGKGITRVKEDMDRHMARVREASRLQRDLFAGVRDFRLSDYEEIRCPFGPEHLTRFVLAAVRELGGTARENADASGVLSVALPTSLLEGRPGLRREYPQVTCDRATSRRRRDVAQFLFTHPAFDALIETARSGSFGGEVARRVVTHADPQARGEYFQLHFIVPWAGAGAADLPAREFVPVLVKQDGSVAAGTWTQAVVFAESTARHVHWEPSPEERERAITVARAWVDGRRAAAFEGRTRQPAVLVGAALTIVEAP